MPGVTITRNRLIRQTMRGMVGKIQRVSCVADCQETGLVPPEFRHFCLDIAKADL
jgi:hypothetical protein